MTPFITCDSCEHFYDDNDRGCCKFNNKNNGWIFKLMDVWNCYVTPRPDWCPLRMGDK